MSSTAPFRVRAAQRSDAASILALIRGLAEYEKAPQEVTNTVEQLQEDGWGLTPRFTVRHTAVALGAASVQPLP